MTFEEYQAAMDQELRAGLAQMMGRSGGHARHAPSPNDLMARRQQIADLAAAARKQLPRNDRVTSQDRHVPSSTGSPDASVRVYVPSDEQKGMPAVLWMHGGAFIFGNPDQDEALCQRIAEEIGGGGVVSVDYRLAPEHPFPAALDDCYAALQWMTASAESLGIDSTHIAVAGASSGGALAAAVALMARDRGDIRLTFELLIYPCLDERLRTSSSREIAAPGMIGNRDQTAQGWQAYLGSEQPTNVSPYAAPARAENLAGLPPSYIMTGELDAVRDDGIEYARRLMEASVPTELHVYPGAFHGFDKMVPTAAISMRATAEYIAALRHACHA